MLYIGNVHKVVEAHAASVSHVLTRIYVAPRSLITILTSKLQASAIVLDAATSQCTEGLRNSCRCSICVASQSHITISSPNVTLISVFSPPGFLKLYYRVGGTTGAIITCPLEVVKTRLQGSNSGFDTRLKPPPSEVKRAEEGQCKATKWTGKVVHQSVYRPALGSQYSVNVQLLKANRHFGSVTPILYSTQSQPCRPLQSKLSAFHDRTSAKVHTGHSITAQTKVRPTMGVWACLCHIVEHEGPRGLFRGLVPNLVGVAPSRAIYFWSYSTAKKTVNGNLPRQNRDTPFVHVLSAATAGFLCNPNNLN